MSSLNAPLLSASSHTSSSNKTKLIVFFLFAIFAAFLISHDSSFPTASFLGSRADLSLHAPSICEDFSLHVKQISGYLSINSSGIKKSFFFWFFQARHLALTAPTALWFSGGPGASSMFALVGENGPCWVLNKTTSGEPNVRWNPYSWTESANMIWVDQPSGTGFSMGVEEDEIVTSEKAVADDMYLFLEAFLIKFPEYATSIYLVGESFGGHYVTAIAHKIVEMNKKVNSANGSKNILIPLKGIAIGNGMTDTLEQLKWYPQMAFNSSTAPSVINQSVFEHMVNQIPRIVQTVRACQQSDDLDQCTEAFELYSQVLMMPVMTTGANVYDLRLQNPYDFTAMDDFFNDPQVIRQIGAKKTWVGVNVTVWQHLAPVDFLHSFQALIPTILEQGIKVLIYAGDQDYICNWLGVQAWTNNMEWEGRESFNLAKTQRWEGGTMKYFKKFAFVTVADSGHMVPMDQPKNSLKLFEALLAEGDFDECQFK